VHYSTHIPDFQLALRSAVAAALAVWVAQLLHLQHPVYALIATVLVTDLSPLRTRKLGLARLAGTVLGAAVGGMVSMLLQPDVVVTGFSILLAMLLSQLLRLHSAARVAGYVCAIVILDHGTQPWSYAVYRTVETFLGIGLAVLVSMVPKLLRMDGANLQDQ
jgi:uncharacterized membrane protein YgaE (UPF0421/DUF939 family)